VHIGATAKLGVYIDSDATQTRGAVVAKTQSGSPAAKAGVRAGDVITSIDGTTITTANQLSRAVTQLRPGQTVAITFTTSSGTTRSSRLTLASGAPQ
jgi:S1-C subfamily serine protease